MKRLLLLVALFGITISPAFCSHWVTVGNGHYVDVDTIVPKQNFEGYELNGRYYEFWTKYVSNGKPYKTIFGKGVVASANKVLLDCQTRFARRLSYFAYDAQGNEIIGLKMVNEQWHHLHPRTVPFEAYQFVCSGKYDLHNFKHLDNLLRH